MTGKSAIERVSLKNISQTSHFVGEKDSKKAAFLTTPFLFMAEISLHRRSEGTEKQSTPSPREDR